MIATQTQISSALQTVGQILDADFRYKVPVHQRDFAWTLEEVGQLWEDITEAMTENRPEYFLGTIVVTEIRQDKMRFVIDGQQRLAALTMILAGIRSVYCDHDDDRDGEVYTSFLGVRDRRTRLTEPRLGLNRTNAEVFQRLVVDHVPEAELIQAKRDKSLDPSNLRLIRAAEFIRGAINKRVNAATKYETFVLDLEEFIRDRVVMILVAVGDDADAYLIFETLNDRGLDLSISDLLKNYIYSKAGNRLSEVQKQWEEMIFLLGTQQDATQFLRHFWLSQYGVVRERDLYKELRRKFATPQTVLTLMSELRDAADKYAAISNVDHAIWKGYGTQVRRDLEALQLFGLSQFRPLLLAVLDRLSEQEVPKVIRIVVVLSMRYSIIGSLGTGNIERAYSDAAIKVREKTADTAAKIFEPLKWIYPDDERFQADFAFKVVGKPKLARYILAGIANKQQGGELGVIEDERKVTLEHIMPKTKSRDWEGAANDEAEYLENVDRLGNLTLIERDANRAAGNDSFDQKKRDAFGKSDIGITKEICNYNDWTVGEIDMRQKQLAETAAKVWSLPY